MIKTIIFDIGNVLMRFDYMPYIKNLLKDDAIIEKVNEAIWRTGYWDQLDLGRDPQEVFARMVDEATEYKDEVRLALDNVGQCLFGVDYARPWIRELKERGYQVLYLSNYSEHIMKANLEVLNFLPLMDGGVFSCYVGLIKPDRAIYQVLCDTYQLNPDECIFIDDNADNIKAAREFGLHAIQFTGYETARKELENALAASSAQS